MVNKYYKKKRGHLYIMLQFTPTLNFILIYDYWGELQRLMRTKCPRAGILARV